MTDTDKSMPVNVTVDWLRDETVGLFQLARAEIKLDHAVCFRYLEFLYEMLPKAERTATQPAGRSVRDEVWKEASLRQNHRVVES